MTKSRKVPRGAAALLGVIALGVVLAAIGGAPLERPCGHRQVLLLIGLGKLRLGDSSHEEAQAAAARWRTQRAAEDFQRIASHLPAGTSSDRLLAVFGKPDDLQLEPPHGPGHAARAQVDWIYRINRIVSCIITVDELEGVLLGFSSRRKYERCLAAGTPVLTERGETAVEDLRVGDRVWGYDLERNERVLTRVQAISAALAGETLVLGRLRLTPEHPVFVSGDWSPAGEVREGDRLLAADGKARPAARPVPAPGPVRVFDLEVEEPHSFFAGGFLVHNKTLRPKK